MFTSIGSDRIKSALVDGNFDVLRIDQKFDVEHYRKISIEALQNFRPINKDGYSRYKAIGLQYADPENPLYDAVAQLNYISDTKVLHPKRRSPPMINLNEVGLLYKELIDYFSDSIEISRARLLVAEPGFKMKSHTDGIFCGTLHFPLITDPECRIIVDGKSYHLPADGHFYLINVAKPHSVQNNSQLDRIHLTFPITPASFHFLSAHEFDRFRPFFELFKIDISRYGISKSDR